MGLIYLYQSAIHNALIKYYASFLSFLVTKFHWVFCYKLQNKDKLPLSEVVEPGK